MLRFPASISFLCVLGASLLAQQSQTATLQEKLTTSDSVQATVTQVSGDIRAGEMFEFTVKLDPAPNFAGGGVASVVVGPNPSDSIATGCEETQESPRGRLYRCRLRIPATAPGGIWKVKDLSFYEGTVKSKLSFEPITFRVIPNTGLVLPTSAEITVNLNQIQLLRSEATHLQERIQQLKSAVSEYVRADHEGAVPSLLRQNLSESVNALTNTQAEFSKLTTNGAEGANAKIFFDDLRKSYENAISHLARATAVLKGEGHLVRVSGDKKATAEPFLSLALRPMEQNELAYKVVADQGSLTFDLEVDSTPEGAAVTYNRKGDPPRGNPDPTRSTIPSLAYAIWIVHFEKPGYKTEEREHDPFREPNHIVHVDLQK